VVPIIHSTFFLSIIWQLRSCSKGYTYYEWTMCPSSSCNNIKTIIMWTKEGFHPTSNQEYRIIGLTFSFFNELATCLLLASQYYIMQMDLSSCCEFVYCQQWWWWRITKVNNKSRTRAFFELLYALQQHGLSLYYALSLPLERNMIWYSNSTKSI
jgi:hypothetical protein